MALKFRRGTTAQQSGSLAFGEPYVNTTLGTLLIGGPNGDIVLSTTGTGSTGNFGPISGSGLDITGNARIGGNLTLGGTITIGDATTDNVVVNADLSSSIIPNNDNAFDLGSASFRYRAIYGTNIYGTINATNGVVSGSSQLPTLATTGSNTFKGNQTIIGSGAGFAAYISTSVNDATLGLDTTANVNALYFLKNGEKNFELSYDTTNANGIFRLLPYDNNSFFEIGNPSNSGADYVFISEPTYGNVLIGPGIGNGVSSLGGSIPATDKVQMVGNLYVSGAIRANSFTGSIAATNGVVSGSSQVVSILTSLNTYTGSNDTTNTTQNNRLSRLEESTSSLNAFSASENTKSETLRLYTASVDTKFTTLQTLTASTAAQISRLQESTASLNAFSASENTKSATLATYTASVDLTLARLRESTASINLTTASLNGHVADINTWSASVKGHITDINSYTSSLKTAITVAGSDVTVAGNLTVNGTTTTVNSTTVNIGDSILELNYGGAAVRGGLLIKDATAASLSSGSFLWDGTNDVWVAGKSGSEAKVLTDGMGVVSGSAQITAGSTTNFATDVKTQLNSNTVVSGSSQIDATATTNFSTGVKTQLNTNAVVSGSSQVNFTQLSGISANIISASTDSSNVDFIISGGSITANLFGGVVSGSAQVIGILSSLNSFSASNGNTSLNTYTGSNDTTNTTQNTRLTRLEESTSSLNAFSASENTKSATLALYTASVDTKFTTLQTLTASVNAQISRLQESTASLNAFSASENTKSETLRLYTASVDTKFSTLATYTGSNDTTNTTQNTRLSRLEESTSSLNAFSASENTKSETLRLYTASLESKNSTLALYTASNDTKWSTLGSLSGSFARTNSTNVFTGNQTITGSLFITQDLIVGGSSSIQNISSSRLDIGDNIIQLNVNNPVVRFGGIAVFDSGSAGGSGSFLYDSVHDEFIFVHRGNGTNVTSSHFVLGPETIDNLGNETYLTNNRLPKGSGKEHLNDSNITDTGTLITLGSNTVVNGTFVASGTSLVSGSSQISHDSTTGYSANRHIDHTAVSITAGSGLSGGGDISATRTLSIATGGVTDAMLAGSISNAKLTNSSITIAGQSTALGSSVTAETIRTAIGTVVTGSAQITAGSTTNFATDVKTQLNVNTVISGSSQVFSNVSGDVTIASNGVATIAANSVALGTDTTGNYMTNVSAGNAGIVISHTQSEGSTATISLVGGVVSGSAQIDVASTTGDIALGTRTSGNYVASMTAGTGITVGTATGEGSTPVITNTGVTSNVAGTGVTVSGATGAVTISIGQAVATSSSPTFAGLTINGAITATGDITAYYTSDKRHKNNIQIIPNALEKVRTLNGVTWEWNDDVNEVTKSTPKTGLIAQEVQSVLPEVVIEKVDGFLGLDYSKMMGLMVEAIKEQQLHIEKLQLEVADLKKQKGL